MAHGLTGKRDAFGARNSGASEGVPRSQEEAEGATPEIRCEVRTDKKIPSGEGIVKTGGLFQLGAVIDGFSNIENRICIPFWPLLRGVS